MAEPSRNMSRLKPLPSRLPHALLWGAAVVMTAPGIAAIAAAGIGSR